MEVPLIFQECQFSHVTHRKLAVKLRQIQENCVKNNAQTRFFSQFCDAILHVVTIKRGEPNADRVVKFIGFYISSLAGDDNDDEEEDQTPEFVYEFIDALLVYLADGMASKDKVVRFRINQLVTIVLQNASSVGDECCAKLFPAAMGRLNDRDASIRCQAVLTLTALAYDPESIEGRQILEEQRQLMVHDTSADVRRAALLNLPKRSEFYADFVARSLDISPTNRRALYAKAIPAIGDFRRLNVNERVTLLANGLKDRDPSVRQAATSMLLSNWLRTVNNDMIKLLARLDVLDSDVANYALEAFFKARPDVVADKMVFTDDEFWEDVSPEGVFLVRCFNDHCRQSGMTELAERRLPELAKFAQLLSNAWEAHTEDSDESDFVLEQMLMIAATYDFSDEFGRQAMLQIIDSILTDSRSSAGIVNQAVLVLRRALSLVSDFMLKITDLLDDLNTPPEDPDCSVLASVLLQYSIIEATLRRLDPPYTDLATLNSLYDQFSPALLSSNPRICSMGVTMLALLCLLSKPETDAHFDELLALYDEDPARDAEYDDLEVNIAVVKAASDVLLTHRIYPEMAKRARDIIAHAFGSKHSELKTVAALALAKLFISSLLNNETELLARIIAAYFTSSDEPELEQTLSFFVPVYALTSVDNQRRIALQFASIYNLTRDSGVPLLQLLAQLIEWTSPRRADDINSTVHADLAIGLLEVAQNAPKAELRALLAAAAKLTLFVDSEQAQKISQLLEGITTNDSISVRSLTAFRKGFDRARDRMPEQLPEQLSEHEQTPELEQVQEQEQENTPEQEQTPDSVRSPGSDQSLEHDQMQESE